jgi:hypothetical protein
MKKEIEVIKMGSRVTSKWHPIHKNLIGEVDRIYERDNKRGDGGSIIYCRVVYEYKGETKTYNAPMNHCRLDIS